jgi:ssDNA-specific exonuclease RecJ
MSLNHIEEQTSRKSFETIFFKQKSEQTSYFPSIDKKTPKAYNLKSTSTIISNNEKTENGLSKYIKNPEVRLF